MPEHLIQGVDVAVDAEVVEVTPQSAAEAKVLLLDRLVSVSPTVFPYPHNRPSQS